MGYYSFHDLTVNTGEWTIADIAKSIEKENFWAFEPIDDGTLSNELQGNFSLLGADEVKWYNMEDDMCRLSKVHPGATFIIHREGEDPTDVWDYEFRDGLVRYREYELRELPWTEWVQPPTN